MDDALGALQELLASPEGRADPYPRYDRVRAAGNAVRAADQLLVMVGHAEVDRALRDPRLRVQDVAYLDEVWPEWRSHASLRSLSHSILESNSPDHERMRRLVAGVFTPRRLGHLRDAIATLAGDLIDAMAGRGAADFMADFAYPLPANVICELLGVPEADRAWFRPVAHDLTGSLEPNASDLTAADTASDELLDYFTGLVAAKRRAPGEDLTSALVATHDADPGALSAAELMSNLTLLLVAGFETTTNLLGNGLWTLLERPALCAALRDDPAQVSAYVEEMLRFDSPVQLTSRIVTEATEVCGHALPTHAEVFLLIGAANRDPSRFDRPHVFDPSRPDNAPLSFGAGVHYCVGSALARMEAHVAFPMLLARFPAMTASAAPTRKDRIALRGYADLPITW